MSAIRYAEAPPLYIGRYRIGDHSEFLPVSSRELARSARFFGRILDSFHFKDRDPVLTIATPDEAAQFTPFEKAAMAHGLILMNADHSLYEGHRLEAILRRFPVVGIMGLSGWILDGAIQLGHDSEALFAGRTVWARPCAYDRVAKVRAARVLRWVELGPTVGVECSHGAGVHVDDQEWAVEASPDGEILISSRLPRLVEVERLPTGVHGRIETRPCACGNGDIRILLSLID